MKIPEDTKQMTEKYLIDKGGICGQSCLAVIEGCSIQEVMNTWVEELKMEFKGWSGWKQLRHYLEMSGWVVKQKRWNKIEIINPEFFYILRIQWIGEGDKKDKPFYGWGHWTEASAHTHFIVVNKGKFFCNEDGLFGMEDLSEYLCESGVVTSAMEISIAKNN